jgi:hypothetical protein
LPDPVLCLVFRMGVLCEEPEPAPAKYRAPARKWLHYKAGNMLLFKLLIEVSTLACLELSPTFAIIAPTGWFLVETFMCMWVPIMNK